MDAHQLPCLRLLMSPACSSWWPAKTSCGWQLCVSLACGVLCRVLATLCMCATKSTAKNILHTGLHTTSSLSQLTKAQGTGWTGSCLVRHHNSYVSVLAHGCRARDCAACRYRHHRRPTVSFYSWTHLIPAPCCTYVHLPLPALL